MATIVLEYADGISVVEVAAPRAKRAVPGDDRPVFEDDRVWIGLSPSMPPVEHGWDKPDGWYLAAGGLPLSGVHAEPTLAPDMSLDEVFEALRNQEGLLSVRLNGTPVWAAPPTDAEVEAMLSKAEKRQYEEKIADLQRQVEWFKGLVKGALLDRRAYDNDEQA